VGAYIKHRASLMWWTAILSNILLLLLFGCFHRSRVVDTEERYLHLCLIFCSLLTGLCKSYSWWIVPADLYEIFFFRIKI